MRYRVGRVAGIHVEDIIYYSISHEVILNRTETLWY